MESQKKEITKKLRGDLSIFSIKVVSHQCYFQARIRHIIQHSRQITATIKIRLLWKKRTRKQVQIEGLGMPAYETIHYQ